MLSIIVAFPKIENAKKIKNLLQKNSFDVSAVCTKGSSVVALANKLDGGIVICGYKLQDMHYSELIDYIPKGFRVVLVASATKMEECMDNNVITLKMPIKVQELVNTIRIIVNDYEHEQKKKVKPKGRSEKDKQIINKAKEVLMDKNSLTEEEAHRYIQKNSMDSGSSMVETAQKIMLLYGGKDDL